MIWAATSSDDEDLRLRGGRPEVRASGACSARPAGASRPAARPRRRRPRRHRAVRSAGRRRRPPRRGSPPRATLRTIAPGFIRAIESRPIRPFVAFVSGTWTVMTSERAEQRRRGRRARRRGCAACSAETNGSTPMTVISIARARSAMASPILPSPTMPSVRPRSSRPVNWARFHSPRRTDASAAAIRRATPYSSARVCSAAAIVLPVGALTTVIPARVAASRSTLSTPTPARPMTTRRVPAAISAASTWTWLRTTSASYSPMAAHSSSRLRPWRSSTS